MDKVLFDYLNSHQGIAYRVKTIFEYHYDQIIREIKAEVPERDHDKIIDSFYDLLEESAAFPDLTGTLQDFINNISHKQ